MGTSLLLVMRIGMVAEAETIHRTAAIEITDVRMVPPDSSHYAVCNNHLASRDALPLQNFQGIPHDRQCVINRSKRKRLLY
jgi:hypothetical protein